MMKNVILISLLIGLPTLFCQFFSVVEGTLIDMTGRKFEQEITETDNKGSVPSVYSCSIVFPSCTGIVHSGAVYDGQRTARHKTDLDGQPAQAEA